jgi:hypothetical protein
MTPFVEIADTFDAIGIDQDLQSCGNPFIADRHGKFLAALRDQNDHHRGLLPPRFQQRENYAVEIRFGHRCRQANLIPRDSAADRWDFLIASRRLEVWILLMNRRQQLLTQSGDNFSKRSVESQSFLFPETGDGYSRTIQCDVGLK